MDLAHNRLCRAFTNCFLCFRFSIDRNTDQEQIFNIDPVTGAITLAKILDRETAGWHNITVTAMEAGDEHGS